MATLDQNEIAEKIREAAKKIFSQTSHQVNDRSHQIFNENQQRIIAAAFNTLADSMER